MSAHPGRGAPSGTARGEKKTGGAPGRGGGPARPPPGPAGSVDTNTRRPSAIPPAMLCLDPRVLRRSSADVAENDSSLISSAYGNPAREGNNTFVVARLARSSSRRAGYLVRTARLQHRDHGHFDDVRGASCSTRDS